MPGLRPRFRPRFRPRLGPRFHAAVTVAAAVTILAGADLPPPDPGRALAAEYARARAAGSNAALIGFIARHPDAALTAQARAALAARRQPDPVPDPGPDGAIVAAFDRARLGGPAALAAFAAAYPNHPLGLEAHLESWRTAPEAGAP